MIPRDYITEWRAQAPWPSDAQVEQDLVISRALVELFEQEVIASTMAFRGGTALHKLHLTEPARYSEDIDLVQTERGAIGLAPASIRRPHHVRYADLRGVLRVERARDRSPEEDAPMHRAFDRLAEVLITKKAARRWYERYLVRSGRRHSS
jgi:hypothetical protein